MEQSDHILEVKNLTQEFGSFRALKGISCHAKRGEFLTILGSSGSGKSTLLRILAGLQLPTHVDVMTLEGVDVSAVPASRRNLSTVFQHYGLFPHLNVLGNVEYGLKARKVPAAECREKALKILELVQLAEYSQAGINRLSGGQKQRVALARSLVLEPAILLLDEPLGALDEKLRNEMQLELVNLHRRLGMTFVYVTHSQEEALTMSDRIIVMNEGRIVQEGTPHDIFDKPVSRFVAEFMGIENILKMKITKFDDKLVTAESNGLEIQGVWSGRNSPSEGQRICAAFRSEKLQVSQNPFKAAKTNSIPAKLVEELYRGKYHDFTFESSLGPIRARFWDEIGEAGKETHLVWSPDQTVMMPEL